MKVIFFGGGLFPLKTYTMMSQLNYINKLGLVTISNKSQSGEKNDMKNFAYWKGHSIYEPNLEDQQQVEQLIPQLQEYDLGLVCNYKYMIPPQLIKQIPLFVIHPSLLPDYRGAAPIQWALLNGEYQTGLSFIEISENKFDAGDIVYQTSYPIRRDTTYQDLSQSLATITSNSVDYFLQNYKTLPRRPQGTSDLKAPKQLPKFDLENLKYPIYNYYRAFYGTKKKSIKLKYMGKEIYIEKCSWASDEEKDLLSDQVISSNKKQIYTINQRPYKSFIYLKQDREFFKIEEFRYTDRSLRLKGKKLLSTQNQFD
ncbi:hypothetical protein pb186bvf_014487 [Paramecium bursaria]